MGGRRNRASIATAQVLARAPRLRRRAGEAKDRSPTAALALATDGLASGVGLTSHTSCPGAPAPWERHCLLWRDRGRATACRLAVNRGVMGCLAAGRGTESTAPTSTATPPIAAPRVPLPQALLRRRSRHRECRSHKRCYAAGRGTESAAPTSAAIPLPRTTATCPGLSPAPCAPAGDGAARARYSRSAPRGPGR